MFSLCVLALHLQLQSVGDEGDELTIGGLALGGVRGLVSPLQWFADFEVFLPRRIYCFISCPKHYCFVGVNAIIAKRNFLVKLQAYKHFNFIFSAINSTKASQITPISSLLSTILNFLQLCCCSHLVQNYKFIENFFSSALSEQLSKRSCFSFFRFFYSTFMLHPTPPALIY